MAQCQRPRAQMMTFFGFSYSIFGRKMLQKSPKCQGPGQCNVNLVRATTWLVGVSAVATGWGGGRAPPFWFIQNTVLEHHLKTRQLAIMEKRNNNLQA